MELIEGYGQILVPGAAVERARQTADQLGLTTLRLAKASLDISFELIDLMFEKDGPDKAYELLFELPNNLVGSIAVDFGRSQPTMVAGGSPKDMNKKLLSFMATPLFIEEDHLVLVERMAELLDVDCTSYVTWSLLVGAECLNAAMRGSRFWLEEENQGIRHEIWPIHDGITD